MDNKALESACGNMQSLIKTRVKLVTSWTKASLAMAEFDNPAEWHKFEKYAQMMALEVRRRQQFKTGYDTAPPLLLTSFVAELHRAFTEEAKNEAEAYARTALDVNFGIFGNLLIALSEARTKTADLLRATVGPESLSKLPLKVNFQQSVIKGGTMDAETSRSLAAIDLVESTQQIDSVKSLSLALATIDPEGNYPNNDDLQLMLDSLPALKAIATCQEAELTNPPSLKASDEVLLAYVMPEVNEFDSFVSKFSAVTRECKAFTAGNDDSDFGRVKKMLGEKMKAYIDRLTEVRQQSRSLRGCRMFPDSASSGVVWGILGADLGPKTHDLALGRLTWIGVCSSALTTRASAFGEDFPAQRSDWGAADEAR